MVKRDSNVMRKVVHVYNDFDPNGGGGGVARHIAGVAGTVAGPDIQIRVVAKMADCAAGHGVYQVWQSGGLALWRHVAWADVVHVHGARKPYPAWAAILAALLGRRVIYTPHCYYDGDSSVVKRLAKKLWDASVERWLLRHSAAVILLSEHWRQYLASRRLSVAHPVIVPNCVIGRDIEDRAPSRGGDLPGKPALLSVGRLDQVKRLDDAIGALALPALKGAVLHIVGRGPDAERLADLADKLGVASRVHFHGFADDAEVARMAAAADVFVMPSAAEGLPTVLIEMLLMGLPVVASDIPGNRAILDLVNLDVLFPVGDVSSMAERILAVAGTQVAGNVKDAVRAHFTWERTAHRIAALYLGTEGAQ